MLNKDAVNHVNDDGAKHVYSHIFNSVKTFGKRNFVRWHIPKASEILKIKDKRPSAARVNQLIQNRNLMIQHIIILFTLFILNSIWAP